MFVCSNECSNAAKFVWALIYVYTVLKINDHILFGLADSQLEIVTPLANVISH